MEQVLHPYPVEGMMPKQKTLRLTHHEFAEFYGELCDVICRKDLNIPNDDPFSHTSPLAREVALLIVDRLASAGWLEYR
jgi:hypothetical protein